MGFLALFPRSWGVFTHRKVGYHEDDPERLGASPKLKKIDFGSTLRWISRVIQMI